MSRASILTRWRVIALIPAILVVGMNRPAWTQVMADVEFSQQSKTDPHPVTYYWVGEDKTIREPGAYYYQYYYIGTVNPDARVSTESKIKRVAVSKLEWSANYNWIITKLMLFYQVSNNQSPTALDTLKKLNESPGITGIEAARRILSEKPVTRIIMVTANASRVLQQESLDAGALGYLVKKDIYAELEPAVEKVMDDRQFVSESARVSSGLSQIPKGNQR